MIRIDEIYNNTFWPYFQQNVPLTRMFFCDPPGKSDPENLFNYGSDVIELNYILFHDQEPIHLDLHQLLFDDADRRNQDLNNCKGPRHAAVVTSEYNSEIVQQVCMQYNWRYYYYFFHGWAALDWYRGYDKTFLMPEPESRSISKSFINPNRIIGGRREHRVSLMYHLLNRQIKNAWTSFPAICPAENISALDLAEKFEKELPGTKQLFATAGFPWNFPNETNHPMHSCWLSLFDLCSESLAYVVTETVFSGKRNHLTEKTFKPICLRMPFVLVSTAGSLQYLRHYGFKTFNSVWNESYDNETDDQRRLIMIADLLKDLDSLSTKQKQQMFDDAKPIIEHNYQHFYSGAFEKILWAELTDMLSQINHDFSQ